MHEGVLHAIDLHNGVGLRHRRAAVETDGAADNRALKVSVELTVKAGAVGVGILNSAESAFLTERLVSLHRVVTVDLTASDAAFGRLVFRNAEARRRIGRIRRETDRRFVVAAAVAGRR